ncbi:MAG TPA: hypothetical protein VFK41_02725 [Nocardioidaceae bacterium]|nr:hypothetical protein [Nocardioidaceae bacterium]
MEATLLLANSAEEHANKGMVNALGLGWSVTGTPTPPISLVLMIQVPWDQTNIKHQVVIDLLDADGHPATVDGGGSGIRIEGTFEAGRPAGSPHGVPIDTAMIVNLGPGMTLSAGASYQWRVQIDGEVATTRRFQVRG